MKIIKIVVILALFLIALALGSENRELVTFNFLFVKKELHLSTLLGGVFVTGFAIAWAIFGTLHLKSKLQVRKLQKQLSKLAPASTEVEESKA